MVSYSKQAATCNNSFPKIFGGSEGNTYLNHIDIFSDYLAMVGSTEDITLAGSSGPFIAVASVSIPDRYYWAKKLLLKADELAGVQFS